MATGPGVQTAGGRFASSPTTRMGRMAVTLGVIFVVMFLINSFIFISMPETSWGPMVLPFYGILMMVCGLLAGVLGVISLVKGERSWMVWLICVLPGLWVVFMLAGELLFPH